MSKPEKPKKKTKKRKQTQYQKDQKLARNILEHDLYESIIQAGMTETCFQLEKKRRPGDYIR